jgi:2,4-dienoyl-CoA reductase-like NADH-dependent reductase (Old Yellow Enzyme family)
VDGGAVDLIDMSLWDVNKEPVEPEHQGRRLVEQFAELPRGGVRLGAAGRIHMPADVQRALDDGLDLAVLGRVGILHHDYPRLASDPDWVPRQAPVPAEVLAAEGVSPAFIEYLRATFRFVAEQ